MRKKLISVCAVILVLCTLCSGCAAIIEEFENAEIRQTTETMLDALIANDLQAAYSLAKNVCAEEDFKPIFAQLRDLLQGADSYTLKMLSVYANTQVANGQKINSCSAVYEMMAGSEKIIIHIEMNDQIGLNSFYLTPYEKTDYYSTGTLNNMTNASAVQRVFFLLNVVAIGFTVFALVDCCRKKIKKKVLWILLLILGFFTIGITVSASVLRLNFNLGWVTAYSAWIRYGSGSVVIRLMLPVGAIVYFCTRRSLLEKPDAEVVLSQADTAEKPSDLE